MELRQLRYFAALAEELNFHRAAERLNMSQPPLTVAIRKLEEDLGARLFERGSKGVRLTDAGSAALRPAYEALNMAERVREAARLGASGETGQIRLGFVGSAVGELLPRIIPAYRNRYPEVELVLEEMTSVTILAALDQRKLDAGLVRLPVVNPTNSILSLLERDRLIVALPRGHRLAEREQVRLESLADEPFILHANVSILRSICLLACQRAGFVPHIAQEITQVQTALSLVQSGLGVALVPARMTRFAPEGVALLELRDPVLIEMGIARREDSGRSVENFVQSATAMCNVE